MRISDWSSDVCSSDLRYFGRLDWQGNDDHRVELTYQRLDEGSPSPDDFSSSSNSPRVTGLNTFFTSGTKSDYYSGRLYSQWSDEFSTELRYSRSKITDRQDPIGGGEAQSDNPIPRIIVGVTTGDPGNEIYGQVLAGPGRSEEHTSELQSLMRTSYDVVCLKKKK